MPIYEYYCPDCHTVFSFYARRVASQGVPACPTCGRTRLQKEVSAFAATTGKSEDAEAGGQSPMDDTRLTRAMESLAGEAAGLREDDPKQAAQLMRKLAEMTGAKFAGGMEEAMQRLAAGEDPDAIESSMGDVLESEDPFTFPEGGGGTGSRSRRMRGAPRRDPGLYDL